MTRTEILTRYRRLRQISNEHHHAVLGNIAPDVLLDWAKRIGVAEGKTVVFENEHELTLVQDLATYLPRPSRSHPLDRYARNGAVRARLRRGDRARGDAPRPFLRLAYRAAARHRGRDPAGRAA